MNIDNGEVMMGGLVALAGAGWNLYLHSKIAVVHSLLRWKDELEKRLAARDVAEVKEYATKTELKDLVDKRMLDVEKYATKADMNAGFTKLEQQLDKLVVKLDEAIKHKEE